VALFAQRRRPPRHRERLQGRALHPPARGAGEAGHQVQPGRARLPGAATHQGRGEAADRSRQHPLLRPAGHPPLRQAVGDALPRDARHPGDPGAGGGLPRREAAHRVRPADLLRPGGRGGLPEPRLPDLRVVHPLRRGDAGPHPHWTRPAGFSLSGKEIAPLLSPGPS